MSKTPKAAKATGDKKTTTNAAVLSPNSMCDGLVTSETRFCALDGTVHDEQHAAAHSSVLFVLRNDLKTLLLRDRNIDVAEAEHIVDVLTETITVDELKTVATKAHINMVQYAGVFVDVLPSMM